MFKTCKLIQDLGSGRITSGAREWVEAGSLEEFPQVARLVNDSESLGAFAGATEYDEMRSRVVKEYVSVSQIGAPMAC